VFTIIITLKKHVSIPTEISQADRTKQSAWWMGEIEERGEFRLLCLLLHILTHFLLWFYDGAHLHFGAYLQGCFHILEKGVTTTYKRHYHI
jgi:hypothetical protein